MSLRRVFLSDGGSLHVVQMRQWNRRGLQTDKRAGRRGDPGVGKGWPRGGLPLWSIRFGCGQFRKLLLVVKGEVTC